MKYNVIKNSARSAQSFSQLPSHGFSFYYFNNIEDILVNFTTDFSRRLVDVKWDKIKRGAGYSYLPCPNNTRLSHNIADCCLYNGTARTTVYL